MIGLLNCSSTDDELSGIFPNSTLIEIVEPENNAKLAGVYPIFKWNTKQTSESDMLVIAIYNNPLSINEINDNIFNYQDIIWVWINSFEGDYGAVKFSAGKKVVFSDGIATYTGGSGNLVANTTYYWSIWIYDKFGYVKRSSNEYRFTF